jgi:hypothetical protein
MKHILMVLLILVSTNAFAGRFVTKKYCINQKYKLSKKILNKADFEDADTAIEISRLRICTKSSMLQVRCEMLLTAKPFINSDSLSPQFAKRWPTKTVPLLL